MPPVTTSPALVIAALDSKESGVTKVTLRWQRLQARGCGKGPVEAGSRESPMGATRLYKGTLGLYSRSGESRSGAGCGRQGGRAAVPGAGGADGAGGLSPGLPRAKQARVTTSQCCVKVTRPSEDLPNFADLLGDLAQVISFCWACYSKCKVQRVDGALSSATA